MTNPATFTDCNPKANHFPHEQASSEQSAKLVTDFPIGSKVRVKHSSEGGPAIDKDLYGKVEGYQTGGRIERGNELALRVHVPADIWVLYSDQVELSR